MEYFLPISKDLDTSTMIKTALCDASAAKSLYTGYKLLQGVQVAEVKKTTAHEFWASDSRLSNSSIVVTPLTAAARW